MPRLRVFAELASTMDEALAHPPETVVLALRQTAGVGRTGPWQSTPGSLHCTFVTRRFDLTHVAVAAARLLGAALKWPNDLLLPGGKCGGVLEHQAGGVGYVGLGVNLVPVPDFATARWDAGPRDLAERVYREALGVRDGEYRALCGMLGRAFTIGTVVDVVGGVLLVEQEGTVRAASEVTSARQLVGV
ncbi:Biotin-(Acetyl-CoA-carboxylase) ligase [Spironucleus salmonicida]|uniref:Biotin-(Acetyl-CoA-carboxylase) ligase n=1 Tax=Spironucleus salmonicida TaxID=348837 RepID=V6LX77_9EUKA|nr:Biotin-(Acetyl-CoA-carboxylase) ligase [Spironucleus salmonicida]|eukprot:EST48321.1 Biotin-(acetyl-CoA-carboxylase) ligase [Spironucleus salmonicida]